MENLKPTKQDWEHTKRQNENLIVGNLIQIEMAKDILKLCDEKIAEFPPELEPDVLKKD